MTIQSSRVFTSNAPIDVISDANTCITAQAVLETTSPAALAIHPAIGGQGGHHYGGWLAVFRDYFRSYDFGSSSQIALNLLD